MLLQKSLSCPRVGSAGCTGLAEQQPCPEIGGVRHKARLSIDPWDLKRLVVEEDRLGREGIEVIGFGYEAASSSVVLSKSAGGVTSEA